MKNHLRAFALGSAVILGASAAHAQPPSDVTTSTPGTPEPTAAASPDPEHKDQSFIEAAREWAKETKLLERFQGTVDGWYPRIGGITRGSGFAAGPGYRTHVFGERVLLDTSAGFSVRGYKAFDARARWWQGWSERVEIWTAYRFEDFPQEDFFGVGPDTTEDMRVSYGLRKSDIVLRGQVRLLPWLRTGATLGYMHPTIGPGSDREFPSIEARFVDLSAPGLTAQPDFLHSELFAEIDTRDAAGNPASGSVLRASFGTWNDRTLDLYDFHRFDSRAAYYVPLTSDRTHVLSGYGGVSFVNNAPGNRVPFYFLPYVGGTDTVRSFREFRFKDENAAWFGAEYRRVLSKWVSATAFADFGKVAHDWQAINASDLKHGFGFGVRAHTPKQTLAKLDVGFGGGEGWRMFLNVGFF